MHLDSPETPLPWIRLFDPGATVSTDCAGGAAASAPGVLGMMSAFAFDPVARRIWVAHASSPDLAFFDVDNPTTPTAVALPAGAAVQLAVVDRTLFAVDAAGHLSAVDLTATSPQAEAALDLEPHGSRRDRARHRR